MKRCLASILALTIAVSAMTDVLHLGHYFANKAFIAANYCINKLRPEKHCEGKCYLMEKIKKDKEGETDGIPVQRELTSQLQYVDLTDLNLPEFYTGSLQRSDFLYKSGGSYQYSDRIFHPPRVLS